MQSQWRKIPLEFEVLRGVMGRVGWKYGVQHYDIGQTGGKGAR